MSVKTIIIVLTHIYSCLQIMTLMLTCMTTSQVYLTMLTPMGPLHAIIIQKTSSTLFSTFCKETNIFSTLHFSIWSLSKNWQFLSFSLIFKSWLFNNILYEHQYGKNHSTYMTLHQLREKITSALDKKEYIKIFLDLSKAFDMVTYEIFLSKFKFYYFWEQEQEILHRKRQHFY